MYNLMIRKKRIQVGSEVGEMAHNQEVAGSNPTVTGVTEEVMMQRRIEHMTLSLSLSSPNTFTDRRLHFYSCKKYNLKLSRGTCPSPTLSLCEGVGWGLPPFRPKKCF